MVPGEPAIVSDEVQEILDSKCITYDGMQMTPAEFVESALKGSGSQSVPVQQRYEAVRYTLEPIFDELLRKDLEDWDPKLPKKNDGKGGESDDGGGQGGGDDFPLEQPFEEDDYDRNSPDQMDEDDMIDQLKSREKQREKEEDDERDKKEWSNMTTEQKEEKLQEREDRANEVKYELPEGMMEPVRDIQKDLAKEIGAMSRFWETILRVLRTVANKRAIGGRYKSGSGINMDALIKEYPRIFAGNTEDVRIFERLEIKEKEVKFPETLNVRIIADVSGSMEGPGKMDILKKAVVLLVSSLEGFQTRIQWQKGSPGAVKTKVDTQVWMYDHEIEKVKKFRADNPLEGDDGVWRQEQEDGLDGSTKETYKVAFDADDEDVKLARAISIMKPRGGNDETNALRAMADIVDKNEAYMQKIQSKKALHIDFLITDGGADNANAAKEEVRWMNDIGIVTRAFQIGEVNKGETETFHDLWNSDGNDFGTVVGKDIENLPAALSESLRNIIAGRIG